MGLKKHFKFISILVLTSGLLSACSAVATEVETKQGIPVEIVKVKNVTRPLKARYKGTVIADEMINYGFKTAGKLKELKVKSGDQIEAGDILAILDNSDLKLQLDSAKSQLEAAKEGVAKAQESLLYNEANQTKMKQLYDAGALSEDQMDQLRLSKNIAMSSLIQAEEQVKMLESKFELQQNLLDDSTLVAKDNGVIFDTFYEKGELIGAQETVVTISSNEKVVQVGISQSDIDSIALDSPVKVFVNGTHTKAHITELSDTPDRVTRNYGARISLLNTSHKAGKIVDVEFETGLEKGIWVPMKAVMSDGEKFVYIVENGRAFKRTISVEDVSEFELKISGIDEGCSVVVSGMKKLTDGAQVEPVEKQ